MLLGTKWPSPLTLKHIQVFPCLFPIQVQSKVVFLFKNEQYYITQVALTDIKNTIYVPELPSPLTF